MQYAPVTENKMNKQQSPRLRFKGFMGEWESRKLREVATIKTGVSNREDSDLFGEYTFFDRSQDVRKSNTYLYNCEAVIMAGEGSEFYPKYFVGKFDLHQRSYAIMNFQECDGLFIFYYLHLMNDYFCNQAVGSTVKSLRLPMFTEMPIIIPTKEEQTTIGNFFRDLDSQIAESRAVWEKSRQLKKAMLAKMFPANGKKIPEIRFKGFEGDWERKKLGEVVEIIGGGTPDTTNPAYWNGDIDWYSPTEIGENAYANGSVKKITPLGLQKSSAQILPANKTVLFTSRASIGDMAILTRDGATNQGFQSFVVEEGLDIYFLYAMGFKIKDYAVKNASGSTFLEISKNVLSRMEFLAPNVEEQTTIGNFFRQLDETIALQAAEIEKLTQLKKGLLAAMLV